MAQERIKHHYEKLSTYHSDLPWPEISNLFSTSEGKRLATVKQMNAFALHSPRLYPDFYFLASLIQEAEMVYDHKELLCEDYTSKVTGEIRSLQQQLLQLSNGDVRERPIDIDDTLTRDYAEKENEIFMQGVPYTKLLSYSAGMGQYRVSEDNVPVFRLQGSLAAQEMGSVSSIAMQRGGFVKLGDASVTWSLDRDDNYNTQTWSITALKLRKFKERLNYIPSYFSSAGGIGLGLTLLEFKAEKPLDLRHGTLLGGELMFNLFSTERNNDFAFVSIGANWHSHVIDDDARRGIAVPLHAEWLTDFGKQGRWQWRVKFDYHVALADALSDEVQFNNEISYRLGSINNSLWTLKTVSEYSEALGQAGDRHESTWQNWIGVEFNHW